MQGLMSVTTLSDNRRRNLSPNSLNLKKITYWPRKLNMLGTDLELQERLYPALSVYGQDLFFFLSPFLHFPL